MIINDGVCRRRKISAIRIAQASSVSSGPTGSLVQFIMRALCYELNSCEQNGYTVCHFKSCQKGIKMISTCRQSVRDIVI